MHISSQYDAYLHLPRKRTAESKSTYLVLIFKMRGLYKKKQVERTLQTTPLLAQSNRWLKHNIMATAADQEVSCRNHYRISKNNYKGYYEIFKIKDNQLKVICIWS